MKSNGTDHVDDIVGSGTSRRSKLTFRILIVVALLLTAFAVVMVWDASLRLSIDDVSSLFDESDIEFADGGMDEDSRIRAILMIVRDSPKTRALLAGPPSIEIGGYNLRREFGHSPSERFVVYTSSGSAHRIRMEIHELDDSQVAITVVQDVGLSKLFGWGQPRIAR